MAIRPTNVTDDPTDQPAPTVGYKTPLPVVAPVGVPPQTVPPVTKQPVAAVPNAAQPGMTAGAPLPSNYRNPVIQSGERRVPEVDHQARIDAYQQKWGGVDPRTLPSWQRREYESATRAAENAMRLQKIAGMNASPQPAMRPMAAGQQQVAGSYAPTKRGPSVPTQAQQAAPDAITSLPDGRSAVYGMDGSLLAYDEHPYAGVPVVSSAGMDRDSFVNAITPDQRTTLRDLAESSDTAWAKPFAEIDKRRQAVATATNLTPKQREAANAMLDRQEDDALYAFARDTRIPRRRAEERYNAEAAQARAEQKANEAEQKRIQREEQQRRKQAWTEAVRTARQNLEAASGGYTPVEESAVQAAAAASMMAAGMQPPPSAVPQQSQPSAQAPQQSSIVGPDDPMDYTPQGAYTASGRRFDSATVYGQEVAVVSSREEELSLPPGAWYVKRGELMSGKSDVQIRQVKVSEDEKIPTRQQDEAAVEKASDAYEKDRAKEVRQYEADMDVRRSIQIEAAAAARKALGIGDSAPPDQQAYEAEVRRQEVLLAQSRFKGKDSPEWVRRGADGEIVALSDPTPPRPERLAAMDSIRRNAVSEFYASRGLTAEKVDAHRLAEDAKQYRRVQSQGGMMIRLQDGRDVPAVQVEAGNRRVWLPFPRTADEAFQFVRTGGPYAVNAGPSSRAPMRATMDDAAIPRGDQQVAVQKAKSFVVSRFPSLPVEEQKTLAAMLLTEHGY